MWVSIRYLFASVQFIVQTIYDADAETDWTNQTEHWTQPPDGIDHLQPQVESNA
jgi:hypothetical protein